MWIVWHTYRKVLLWFKTITNDVRSEALFWGPWEAKCKLQTDTNRYTKITICRISCETMLSHFKELFSFLAFHVWFSKYILSKSFAMCWFQQNNLFFFSRHSFPVVKKRTILYFYKMKANFHCVCVSNGLFYIIV